MEELFCICSLSLMFITDDYQNQSSKLTRYLIRISVIISTYILKKIEGKLTSRWPRDKNKKGKKSNDIGKAVTKSGLKRLRLSQNELLKRDARPS